MIKCAGGPITWISRKQKVVALSTTEAEFMAVTDITKQILSISYVLGDIGIAVKLPVEIKEDNNGCILYCQNPVNQGLTKHIDIRYNFVKDHVKRQSIKLVAENTTEMLADLLTKPLGRSKFEYLRKLNGIDKKSPT